VSAHSSLLFLKALQKLEDLRIEALGRRVSTPRDSITGIARMLEARVTYGPPAAVLTLHHAPLSPSHPPVQPNECQRIVRLKPVHGALMHGILVLPLVAWLISRTDWAELTQSRAMWTCIALYSLVVVGAAVASLR
jgi:hypothetical protein